MSNKKQTPTKTSNERLQRAYEIFKINLHDIQLNPENIRDVDPKDPANIRLKKSIIENGLQQPLLIRANDTEGATQPFLAADGNRRLAAMFEAEKEGHKFEFVPCRKNLKMQPEDELLNMFVLNDGEPLNPIEKAEGVRRFKDVYGWEIKDIAKKLSESHTTIQNLYLTSQMPAKVKKVIASKFISSTLALQIFRKAKDAKEFAAQIEELVGKHVDVAGIAADIAGTDESGEDKAPAQKKVTAKDAAKVIGETNLKKVLLKAYEEIKESGLETDEINIFNQIAELAAVPPYKVADFVALFVVYEDEDDKGSGKKK